MITQEDIDAFYAMEKDIDAEFETDQSAKINECENVQGEQSSAVQKDMKCWALKVGMWADADYSAIVEAHAEARGWKQKAFTGMEVYDE